MIGKIRHKILALLASMVVWAMSGGSQRRQGQRIALGQFKNNGRLGGLRLTGHLRNLWRPRWLKLGDRD